MVDKDLQLLVGQSHVSETNQVTKGSFTQQQLATPTSTQPQFAQNQNQVYQNFVQNQQQQIGGNSPEALLRSIVQLNPQSPLDYFNQSNHPIACIFHLLFKSLAVFTYFFLGLFFSSFTTDYIVIILSAFDFWTVKNITGRLLVELRWWSEVRPDGSDEWVFECKPKTENQTTAFNEKIFWYGQGAFAVGWVALLVINVLAFSVNNVCICGFSAISIGTNFYAYYKCSKIQQEKIKIFTAKLGVDMVAKMMSTSVKIPMSGMGY